MAKGQPPILAKGTEPLAKAEIRVQSVNGKELPMTIDLILVLSLFLGAAWLELLNTIVSVTRERPADHMLFALAFVHFVVLVYWVLATSVLYAKAVRSVVGRSLMWADRFEEILVVTWPASVVGAIVGIVATKLTGLIDPLLLVLPSFIFTALLLLWAKQLRHIRFVLLIVVLFMPYVWIMSISWCGVQVTLNQQYYKIGDVAIVTAKSEGYLFKPAIKKIEFMSGLYPQHQAPATFSTGYMRVVQTITPEMKTSEVEITPKYVSVSYTPEAWWFSRSEYVEISVVP